MIYFFLFLPGIFFVVLFMAEIALPNISQSFCYHRWDWLLNTVGFIMQGVIVPLCGYLIATQFLPFAWPSGKGILELNFFGAFLLNFIGVDFLYYWQHRFFHQVPWAWQWHRCHHASARVDIWATARNSILTNFVFVYLLINPILGFLCKNPAGFFVGATLTASLDVLRHSKIDFKTTTFLRIVQRWLEKFLVMPNAHHRHHHATAFTANFGANLIVWDKLFKTFCSEELSFPYQEPNAPHPLAQLFYPFKTD